MTNEKVLKLFSEKNLVFIATIMKDGSPQVSPVWANYEDGFILVNTAEGRIKHKNILRDPRVAVSVTSNDNPLDMTIVLLTQCIPKQVKLAHTLFDPQSRNPLQSQHKNHNK